MSTSDPHHGNPGGAKPAAPAAPRGYKRSWKNLLINKRYQLRFTLFMVGVSALLISGLGWLVMGKADDATNVAIGRIRGESCPELPDVASSANQAAPAPAPTLAPTPTPAGSGDDGGRRVQIDESSLTLRPVTPNDYSERVAARWACELDQAARIRELTDGRMRILYVLVATGVLLVLGLVIYGIVLTHRVAGPLFKVGLYLTKMRDGRYDKVYDLRKGDQLIDFYEHFKSAHAGVVGLERSDVEWLRGVLAAADKADLASKSPEVAAALTELRGILARKEKSLE